MRLLNLGCGSKRDQSPVWTNVDMLRDQMPDDQWCKIMGERNYLEHDISTQLPFEENSFDGILLAHVVEHFPAQQGAELMARCHRLLKTGGVLMVSVPDAHYFRHVYPQDHGAPTWPDLYGITDPPNPIPTFFSAALWFEQHHAVLCEDSLWCYFTRAGFKTIYRALKPPVYANEPCHTMATLLDRISFSLVMTGVK